MSRLPSMPNTHTLLLACFAAQANENDNNDLRHQVLISDLDHLFPNILPNSYSDKFCQSASVKEQSKGNSEAISGARSTHQTFLPPPSWLYPVGNVCKLREDPQCFLSGHTVGIEVCVGSVALEAEAEQLPFFPTKTPTGVRAASPNNNDR